MAATITACKKQQRSEQGSIEAKDNSPAMSETQMYLVTVSQATATPIEVALATWTTTSGGNAAMPNYFQQHAIYPYAMCVIRKTAKRAVGSNGRESMYDWILQVEYGQLQGATGATTNSRNIRIDVQGQEQTIYTEVQQDDDNTPIINAAKDRYPDPIEAVLYDEIITVSFETNTLNPDLIATTRGKINSSSVSMTLPQGTLTYSRSFDTHTLRLASVNYSTVISSANPSAHAWSVEMVLAYRPDTWDSSLPEKGFRWNVDDDTGVPWLTEYKDVAQYLDADGYKLADGAELVTTDPIQIYKEADLGTLISGI